MDRMCRTEREADGRVDAAQEDKSCCGRWTNQTGLDFRWTKFRVHHLRAAICVFRYRYPLKSTNEGGDALVHRLSSSFQGHFWSYWF